MSAKDIRRIYDYYRKEGEAGHHQRMMYSDERHRKRMRLVRRLLSNVLSDKDVCLDVGCAEGWYTSWISERSFLVIGVDLSLSKLKRALDESSTDRTCYVMASWDNIPLRSSTFDVVLFTEGLEHAIDPIVTLKEITRVTKENGFLLVSASLNEGTREKDVLTKPFRGHLREFSQSSLRELIKVNYNLVEEYHFVGRSNPIWSKFLRFISRFRLIKMIPERLKKPIRESVPVTFGIVLGKKTRNNKLKQSYCRHID